MHTKCKYCRLVSKNSRRAIALVYIEVDDKDLFGQPLVQEIVGCDGKIVEQTKTFTAISKSMVGAAGYIQAQPLFACV